MKKIIVFTILFLFTASPALADTRSLTTKVGDPTVTSAGYASQLVKDIGTYCGGKVTRDNYSCLNSITNLAPDVKQIMINSTYVSYDWPYLQCVGFVQAVVKAVTGTSLDHGGNAIDFKTNVPSGYTFISNRSGTIQPGDLAIWLISGYSYGHIAYVTQVFDVNNFLVAEAMGTSGIVEEVPRSTNYAAWQLQGWLRKL